MLKTQVIRDKILSLQEVESKCDSAIDQLNKTGNNILFVITLLFVP